MDETGILSFSSPRAERERVEAHASPTLELLYAYHRIVRGGRQDPEKRDAHVRPFEVLLRDLWRDHPGLLAEIQALVGPDGTSHHEFELFVLAIELGYVHEEDPQRFLRDLPELPERFLERPADGPHAEPMDTETRQKVHAGIERLSGHGASEPVQHVLRRLWDVLSPAWREAGRAAVREASERFITAFRQKGDVLAALPAHHVAQFEASADKIRAAQSRDRVEVIPLYFASQGGFVFHLRNAYFIGYGIQVEQAFAHTEARVHDIARKMKAYADPTRLMLLTLLANYGPLTPTVGDLAAQLEVSQPTVSGHLRLLKDAGLVRLVKDGTKSFYHLQVTAALGPLEELTDLIDRHQG